MGSMQNYLKQKLNSHLLRSTAYTRPSALYLALFTTKPDKDGANGTEVPAPRRTAYGRVACGPLDANWSDPDANGKSLNLVDFVFDTPTLDWGTPVAFGIADASTGGNFLIVEDLARAIERADRQPAAEVRGWRSVDYLGVSDGPLLQQHRSFGSWPWRDWGSGIRRLQPITEGDNLLREHTEPTAVRKNGRSTTRPCYSTAMATLRRLQPRPTFLSVLAISR